MYIVVLSFRYAFQKFLFLYYIEKIQNWQFTVCLKVIWHKLGKSGVHKIWLNFGSKSNSSITLYYFQENYRHFKASNVSESYFTLNYKIWLDFVYTSEVI